LTRIIPAPSARRTARDFATRAFSPRSQITTASTTTRASRLPLRQTREDLGYTQAQIKRMEEEDAREAQDSLSRILAGDLAALDDGPESLREPEPDDVPEPASAA
jgi:hypothetical protein